MVLRQPELRTMKKSILAFLNGAALVLLCNLITAGSATALSLTTTAGETFEGAIKKSFQETVYLQVADGDTRKLALSDLNGASRAAVTAWQAEHPERVEVFSKAEDSPRPLKTVQPDIPRELKNEGGIVAVWVIIDEKGKVLLSEIHKSTNAKLNDISRNCVAEWRFKPARDGGTAVKCELIIPLRFQAG